jgi:PilZ domain
MKAERVPATTPPIISERRRKPRYWCSVPVTIRAADGAIIPGISVEMSESGMSAVASGLLKVGQRVELERVAGGSLWAEVRHKLGGLYGFEFVELGEKQVRRIAENCKKLDVHRGKSRQ